MAFLTKCPRCGKEHSGSVAFCAECGTDLTKCPGCGKEVSDGVKFCAECGRELHTIPTGTAQKSGKSERPMRIGNLLSVAVVIGIAIVIISALSGRGGYATAEMAMAAYVDAILGYDEEALLDCVPEDVLKEILKENNLTEKQLIEKLYMGKGPIYGGEYMWDPDDYEFEVQFGYQEKAKARYVQGISDILAEYDGDIASECVYANYAYKNLDKELNKEKDPELREYKEKRIKEWVKGRVYAYKYEGKWYSEEALETVISAAED